jgi:hypothetical protein
LLNRKKGCTTIKSRLSAGFFLFYSFILHTFVSLLINKTYIMPDKGRSQQLTQKTTAKPTQQLTQKTTYKAPTQQLTQKTTKK